LSSSFLAIPVSSPAEGRLSISKKCIDRDGVLERLAFFRFMLAATGVQGVATVEIMAMVDDDFSRIRIVPFVVGSGKIF